MKQVHEGATCERKPYKQGQQMGAMIWG